jgi:hypothetical protein
LLVIFFSLSLAGALLQGCNDSMVVIHKGREHKEIHGVKRITDYCRRHKTQHITECGEHGHQSTMRILNGIFN